MRRILAHVLLYCLLFCFSNSLIAQSTAGSMPNDTLFICDYTGIFRVQSNGDHVLDDGDTLNYIIANEVNGNEGAISIDGVFLWEELLDILDFSANSCNKFFISTIVGEADTEGRVITDNAITSSLPQLLVTFDLGVAVDTMSTLIDLVEDTLSLTAGSGFATLSLPCEGRIVNRPSEKSAPCDYECPCVDTLYVPRIDTVLWSWVVLEADSTILRTAGDTIFRDIPNPTNPTNPNTSSGMHIDTIIISSISDENTSIRVQNADNLIVSSSFFLDFQPRDTIYELLAGELIIDTLLVPSCGDTSEPECGVIQVDVVYPIPCNPIPLSIGFDTIASFCEGSEIELSAREIQGATYLWNTENADTTLSIMVRTVGYYEVTITNNECILFIQGDNIRATAPPAYSSIKKSCNSIADTYQVRLRLHESIIDTNSISVGRLVKGIDNYSIGIVDIPITDTLYFLLKHEISKCEIEYMIVPPPDCLPPVALHACTEEDSIVATPNDPSFMTIDWYGSPTGDDILKEGQSDFRPPVRGTYYAQARYLDSGFVVEERTPVIWGVDAPILDITHEVVSHCKQKEGEITLEINGDYPPYEIIWEDGEVINERVELAPRKYPLIIRDRLGCFHFDTIQIRHDSSRCEKIYIPNIFSPNGDARNDVFQIGLPSYFKQAIVVEIFDRTGRPLFETQDQDNDPSNGITLEGWDGTFLGKSLGQGIYICKVSTTRPNKNELKVILIGEVNLVR